MKKAAVFLGIALLTFVTTLSASSGQAAKQPWQWTLDERLAARYDAPLAAARVAAARGGEVSASNVTNAAQGRPIDVISGIRNPELLLPGEVFDYLMAMAFADDPDTRTLFREAKAKHVAAIGLPADFWDRLELIANSYLSDVRQNRDLHKKQPRAEATAERTRKITQALEQLKCRDRARAIADARQAFGYKFDQFLYVAIAPSLTVTTFVATPAERVREIEGGCQ